MFFDSEKDLSRLAQAFSTTIFVVDPETKLNLAPLLVIQPSNPSTIISIDEIRDLISFTNTKQTTNRFLLIKYAENLNEKSSNALLKTIEEPGQHIHIIFFTQKPSLLLPTIRSRAMLFRMRKQNTLQTPPKASPDILDYAKKLLVANTSAMIDLVEEVSKKKTKKTEENSLDNDRTLILQIIETTIELAYKSYYKTKNQLFLKKINGLIQAHEAILKNGNKKLQLIANLL